MKLDKQAMGSQGLTRFQFVSGGLDETAHSGLGVITHLSTSGLGRRRSRFYSAITWPLMVGLSMGTTAFLFN
ncbi:uncharacterized protein BDR25DRAFT_64736 [Lindgomyces ingoldianus]|uniref:Uncharacterized protein n=1 Tax=Lindgomyces ingoldianus TaxID=673940 RepID=A0ACB6RAJ5_9PLEO|nr:uncharacterized protein BDR25DRAFT_64736 [Lindgomyces ingoldianus]KAF2476259.1 hypothetical protein BDR25DRAFT_64736 [Lindgomyces ingoldianus]